MAIGMALVAMGNLVVALAANLSLYWLVLGGMMITGSGAGMLNGNTQKAIMLCVPRARTGMASGISTTTRFTAIVLAVACLGCILSMRTSRYMQQGFAAAQLSLPADAGNVVSRVVAGDSAAALVALGDHLPALQIVQTGFAHAFSLLMLVAAGLAASCGVLLFWLMGRTKKQTPTSIDAAVEHI